MFFEEYFEYMDDMTAEQYYQFMKLIRDVRFKGCDKDPSEIDDKTIRLAWRAIRPSVLKSARNARDYRKNKEKLSKADEPVATIQVEEVQTETKPQTQEPIVNIQTEEPYTQTATPQPSEHQAPVRTNNEWAFDAEDDAINYLVDVWSKEGLHTMERQRKYILDANGYEFKGFITKLKERYNG